MNILKTCFKCNITQSIDNFYKHAAMEDKHLNKCKSCCKIESKQREEKLRNNPEWNEKEKIRAREKYHRLDYKEKHKPTTEKRRESMKRYKEKYPEKIKASASASTIVNINGHNHHWSYNKEHWKDVIDVTEEQHNTFHRFIIYDQERMMYRRVDTLELLDTKEKHLIWVQSHLPF